MNKEEYNTLYERLEYTKSGALMEDDFELASRIDRAMIALEAPLDKDIFKKEFIEDFISKSFEVNKGSFEVNKGSRFIKKILK